MKLTKLFCAALLSAMTLTASAQRVTDKLDRGLIGIPTTSGIFVTWRIQADEYYDVKYNLYRDGSKIAENLTVSNFTDTSGSTSSKYTVAAVINGKEQAQCAAVTPWAKSYFEITPKHDSSLKCTYIPNDGECADVDGDGEVEILLKYDNNEEHTQLFPKYGGVVNDESTNEYTLFEVLKLDGTVLWWVNCGPNMGDFQNNEQNIVGYDWDQDGKAEVVMRLEEGSEVHMADGTVYTIGADGKNGTSWTNYREPKGDGTTEWFTHYGNEFLFYCEGATGKPYQCIEYPLKRLESGETDLNAAWGDGYGHRSSKYFFGAPYLDGRHPSIFLGRGIYTRHKFIAYDVDPATHALTQRWYWSNNQKGSPWYGEGYHNYAVVDVDWDGRDEIVWGSMVIDDNGLGLSTTGLGHGDAQHHGDFDPYTYGQEGFFCNEDKPANNYRDLTTSKFYHRVTGSNDDGRAICGQFDNKVPGAIGFSAHDNAISCVTGDYSTYVTKTGVSMNFRCYWDGDLEEESFDGGGSGGNGHIYKYGNGDAIQIFDGSISNNSTKSTPTFMGDILGDWREEFIMRDANNHLRIYATTIPTENRNYSLWYDKQYRNGMVWEPCGYNQPPHASYYLGDLEGITMAPPAETMMGRTEVANGGAISNNGESVITCETNDMTVSVTDGATPYLYIDNAPSWVQGWEKAEGTDANDPSKIKYTYYTHTLTGGAFAGDMRLIKQGAGTLVMPKVTETYNGKTEVWAGSLNFDGTLQNSKLWLNRLTALNSDGGTFSKGIQADYGAVIRPGGVDAKASSITTDTLALGFGAVCELDIYSEGLAADNLNAKVLSIEKKVWPYGGGPAYDSPIFRINAHALAGEKIADGKYCLGTVGKVVGSLNDIVIENMSSQKTELTLEDGKLYLNVTNFKGEPVVWKGDKSGTWDLDNTENFTNKETGEAAKFVTDSPVTFDDSATKFVVTISGNVKPGSINFANTSKTYNISGDSIVGEPVLTKDSTGVVYINNVNHMGNTIINGGKLNVASLANTTGDDYGSLGSTKKNITLKNGGTLGIINTITSNQKIIAYKGAIDVLTGKTLTQAAAITSGGDKLLTKTGAGTLNVTSTMSFNKLTVAAGTVNYTSTAATKPVELSGTCAISGSGFAVAPLIVDSAAKATYTTTNRIFTNTNKITGKGQLTVYCATEKGTNYYAQRTPLQFDLSDFEGTLVAQAVYSADNNFTLNTDKGCDKWTLNTNGLTILNYGKSLRIGQVTGTGSLGGNDNFGTATSNVNNWMVGDSTDFTFPAAVIGNARFTKMGTGMMKVTVKTWTNTGATNVNEGTLFCSGGTIGKAICNVAAGATLCGFGGAGLNLYTTAQNNPMTNTSYVVNGTLQCMYSLTSQNRGCWYLNNKNVTINNGGELKVGIQKVSTSATVPNCAHIFGINKLTMADNAKLTVFFGSKGDSDPTGNVTYKPTATEEQADTFIIFGAKTTAIGDIKYNLPSLSDFDAGTNQNGRALAYAWDTSLVSSGKLMITRGFKGDVNGDGNIDINDVNAVISVICGEAMNYRADVNNDGTVDINDVNEVISIICGN